METQSLSQEEHLNGRSKQLEAGQVSQNNNISNILSKMRGNATASWWHGCCLFCTSLVLLALGVQAASLWKTSTSKEIVKVGYAQHKVKVWVCNTLLQSNTKDEKTGDRTCGNWRLLLFQTLITPEMERKKGMRERKIEAMMYQSQDLTVPGSTGISAPT